MKAKRIDSIGCVVEDFEIALSSSFIGTFIEELNGI